MVKVDKMVKIVKIVTKSKKLISNIKTVQIIIERNRHQKNVFKNDQKTCLATLVWTIFEG
jgi:hypothetical protein